ncbi:MAG TPA: DUF4388 domain-containing protein [Thermoanaerobaculia bacterium]|nr:DUF4388 domain-containing protein [Thermoanaerobaculia bacterium]
MAFQGSLKELPLADIIQLVAVSGKTGAFDLTHQDDSGQIFLRDGQIVHAHLGELVGEEAVYELAIWSEGEFVFTPGRETEDTTINKSNTNLLMEAARRIDEWQVLSKRIPSTRLVPVFTDDSGVTSVSLNRQEWEVLRKIDERRSIEEIAIGLGLSPFEVSKILYGMVTSGLVALHEDLRHIQVDRLQKMTEAQLLELSNQIASLAREQLEGHPRVGDLEGIERQNHAERESGRAFDATVDLIRETEKLISSARGPNQAKSFLERVHDLVQQS